MRQYLALLTFVAICIMGFTPVYRWWRKEQDAADAEAREARLSELERRSAEEARSREIREERRYLAAKIGELRKIMDILEDPDASGQQLPNAPPAVAASGTEAAEGVLPGDPTESLLNETLGPALMPNTEGSPEQAREVRGPVFRRRTMPEPDDLKVKVFETEETRSKTRLLADRGIPHNRDAWGFIIHLPDFESMADWPRPRAFEKHGYEWTKWVPFTEIPANDAERALDELEAWFLRLAKGEEQPTGGRLTKSCADWDYYEEDPKTRGYRVLWLEPRDE